MRIILSFGLLFSVRMFLYTVLDIALVCGASVEHAVFCFETDTALLAVSLILSLFKLQRSVIFMRRFIFLYDPGTLVIAHQISLLVIAFGKPGLLVIDAAANLGI